MRISFGSEAWVNTQKAAATATAVKSKNSFGSVAARPQIKEQVNTMPQFVYKPKETAEKRFGAENPVIMKPGLTHDTAVFSTSGSSQAKKNTVDSIMQFYLRNTNIPFKQIY